MDPDRIIRRMEAHIGWLGAIGSLAAYAAGGLNAAGGFLVGAGISYVNFRWLRKMVDRLGETAAGAPPRARMAVLLGLRYVLLGAGAYVILKYSPLSLPAALAGLFTAPAAVLLESLLELVRLWNMNRG